MSPQRFFDDLAVALAQPMPRRRVLRLAAGALVGAAVPGMSAGRAIAAGSRRAACFKCWCPSSIPGLYSKTCCPTDVPYTKYTCECQPHPSGDGKIAVCVPRSTCPQERRGCGPCCPPGQKCNTLVGECDCRSGEEPCKPAKGGAKACCKRGTTCCFNGTSSTCCGPEQTCRAMKTKKATCVCRKGTTCGTTCCKRGETCCKDEEGGARCCKKGETCTYGGICCPRSMSICKTKRYGLHCCLKSDTCTSTGCCPKGRAICASSGAEDTCCPSGEYCFWKVEDEVVPLIGVCKKGCAPGNTCGTQCCGAGYACDAATKTCQPSQA